MAKKVKSAGDIIASMADEVSVRASEEFNSSVDRYRDSISSPIELVLLAAMVADHDLYALDTWWFMTAGKSLEDIEKLRADVGMRPEDGIFVWPQAAIGRYRVDFLLSCHFWGRSQSFIVECDGHDYHERTKEQAAHDKARDRWFTSRGYKMLRFTGSEIWADATNCVAEINTALENVFLFPERAA